MTLLASVGARGALTLAAATFVLLLARCTPDYHFGPGATDHCENGDFDPTLGETDRDCGGTDCPPCEREQGCSRESDCADAPCVLGVCQQAGCDNDAVSGDETGLDCGGPCEPCRDGLPCLEALDCASKVCGEDGLCASATCRDETRNADELGVDCGGAFCDDGCGIGGACRVATDCQSGLCDAATQLCALNCARGTDECDGDLDEPCETNLLASAESCGACGHACDLPHALSACTGGACQIEECVDPFLRCNTSQADGCEINAGTDATNCGGCGMVCPDFHGSPRCVRSKCVIECDGAFGDCDGDAGTGCEASLDDVNNCGACGKACPDTDGVPNCVAGECGHADCDDGWGDCDGDGECETHLRDDASSCGRCGNACGAPNGDTACADGECVITRCEDGFDNCDANAEDGGYSTGCEANLFADAKHCGGCANDCDAVAHGTGTCDAGACALNCDRAFDDCDGKVTNGCETDTRSDPNHCGGCQNACSIANATPACVESSCVIAQCSNNHADCNGAEGCETDILSSVQHCGGCSGTCSSAGAVAVSCSNGSCDAPTCDENHRSCDDRHDTGCETDITSVTNCGACGKACGGDTPYCVQSGAAYQCQAKITLAGSSPYPTATAAAGSLSFNVTPRAGTDRLLLVAIVSDSMTANAVSAGIAGARPGSVRFGNQAMSAGPSQAGVNDGFSPDLFVYYLPLGDGAADGAPTAVSVGGSTGPANVVVAQCLQLNGVRQSMPITAFVGGALGAPDPADPAVVAPSLPVTISGSLIYSFISDYWDTRTCALGARSSACPAWSATPTSNLTLVETMATAPLTFYPPNSGTAPMRAFGMVVTASSPSLPAAGSYAPSWSDPNPGRLTHLALAVAPAQAP